MNPNNWAIALVIALISGIIGKLIGDCDKVNNKMCKERRDACQALLGEKIDALSAKIDTLNKGLQDRSNIERT